MANNEEIKIVINADDRASGVLNNVGKSASGLTSFLGPMAKVAGVAVVAGFGAMVAGAVSSVKAFDEAQLATRQMEAVLKSTGRSIDLYQNELEEQAKALQKSTKFSDEAVMSAQNLMLTFTNVNGVILRDSIPLMLDMATAMGTDASGGAIQLGKALNDPVKGITALTRVGVTFTDEQKKMIENFVETGRVADAQRIILDELAKEFGGSAAAAANTFGGQLEILKNQVGELQETIGGAIVTAIQPFVTRLAEFAGREDVQEKFQQIAVSVGNFVESIMRAILAVAGFVKSAIDLGSELIGRLKPAFDIIWIVIQQQLVPMFQSLWNTIKNQLWPALQELWRALQPLMPLFEQFAKLLGIAVVAAILIAVGAITKLLEWSAKLLTGLTQLATLGIKVLSATLDALVDKIANVINGFKAIIDFAKRAADAVSNFSAKGVASSIGKSLGFRAEGGPVSAGSPYIVGERGPELFVPNRSGSIIPNGMGGAAAAGGINIFITGTFMSREAAMEMANKMIDSLKLEMRI